jgi:WD40 repeat protein
LVDCTVKIWNTEVLLKEFSDGACSPSSSSSSLSSLNRKTTTSSDEQYSQELQSFLLLATLTSHTKSVNIVRWSKDGSFLASGSDDNHISIHILSQPSSSTSNGSNSLGGGGRISGFGAKNLENWVQSHTLIGHSMDILDLDWYPLFSRRSELASGSIDNSICIWNLNSGQTMNSKLLSPMKVLSGHSSFIKGLSYDPIGRYLISCDSDNLIIIWNCLQGGYEILKRLEDNPLKGKEDNSIFRRISWSNDGSSLCLTSALKSGKSIGSILRRNDWVNIADLVGHKNTTIATKFCPFLLLQQESEGNKSSQNGTSQTKEVSNSLGVVDLTSEAATSPPPVAASASSLSSIVALGDQDGLLTLWSTSNQRALVVFNDLFSEAITDISWFQSSSNAIVLEKENSTNCLSESFSRLLLGCCSHSGEIIFISIGESELATGIADKLTLSSHFSSLYGSSILSELFPNEDAMSYHSNLIDYTSFPLLTQQHQSLQQKDVLIHNPAVLQYLQPKKGGNEQPPPPLPPSQKKKVIEKTSEKSAAITTSTTTSTTIIPPVTASVALSSSLPTLIEPTKQKEKKKIIIPTAASTSASSSSVIVPATSTVESLHSTPVVSSLTTVSSISSAPTSTDPTVPAVAATSSSTLIQPSEAVLQLIRQRKEQQQVPSSSSFTQKASSSANKGKKRIRPLSENNNNNNNSNDYDDDNNDEELEVERNGSAPSAAASSKKKIRFHDLLDQRNNSGSRSPSQHQQQQQQPPSSSPFSEIPGNSLIIKYPMNGRNSNNNEIVFHSMTSSLQHQLSSAVSSSNGSFLLIRVKSHSSFSAGVGAADSSLYLLIEKIPKPDLLSSSSSSSAPSAPSLFSRNQVENILKISLIEKKKETRENSNITNSSNSSSSSLSEERGSGEERKKREMIKKVFWSTILTSNVTCLEAISFCSSSPCYSMGGEMKEKAEATAAAETTTHGLMILGSSDGSLLLYSLSNGMMLCAPIILGSSIVFLDSMIMNEAMDDEEDYDEAEEGSETEAKEKDEKEKGKKKKIRFLAMTTDGVINVYDYSPPPVASSAFLSLSSSSLLQQPQRKREKTKRNGRSSLSFQKILSCDLQALYLSIKSSYLSSSTSFSSSSHHHHHQQQQQQQQHSSHGRNGHSSSSSSASFPPLKGGDIQIIIDSCYLHPKQGLPLINIKSKEIKASSAASVSSSLFDYSIYQFNLDFISWQQLYHSKYFLSK